MIARYQTRCYVGPSHDTCVTPNKALERTGRRTAHQLRTLRAARRSTPGRWTAKGSDKSREWRQRWRKSPESAASSSKAETTAPRLQLGIRSTVSFRQQCMNFWNNHALLPKAYDCPQPFTCVTLSKSRLATPPGGALPCSANACKLTNSAPSGAASD